MPSSCGTCLKCSSRYAKSFVSLEVYESSTEGMFAQMGITLIQGWSQSLLLLLAIDANSFTGQTHRL